MPGTRSLALALLSALLVCFLSFIILATARAEPFIDFNDLPATASQDDPGDSAAWLYTTALVNPAPGLHMTTYDRAGWRSTQMYAAPYDYIQNYFYLYVNPYNSPHMGFSTYAYLEIEGDDAILGNSLRYRVTGAINSNGTWGGYAATKRHYLDFTDNGTDPIAYGVTAGHPTLYFANNSYSGDYRPFPEAQGCNRLSFYYKAPAELTNGEGGYSARPTITMNVGPFNGDGGHWYHETCTQGGGWTHVLIDGHPQHNNSYSSAGLYPLPSSAIPDMGEDYFNTWYRWYVTFKPYEGIAVIPYEILFDEFHFYNDPEPQNNETICSPTVTWHSDSQTFEIGFMDKYKNNQYAHCTYELRYSFSPITNANWSQATPAHILTDPRFYLTERTDGKFAKHWPHYNSVWAPFTLASQEDLNQLTPGSLIHFAVKDISQENGNGPDPIDYSVSSYWTIGGRDYTNHGDTFDYAGDKPVLGLIKRIDFRMPQTSNPGQGSLQVDMTPAGAVSAGAGWRRLGQSTWREHGETETGIQEGDYILEFQTLRGWNHPRDLTANITDGEATQVQAAYRNRNGGLASRLLLLP